MATEKIAPLPLPKAPSQQDLAALTRWSHDLQRVGTQALKRIIDAINRGGGDATGTWSPGISADDTAGTATYTHRRGRWTLQGQDVSLWGDVLISAWADSPAGNLRVHGQPFAHTTDSPRSVFGGVIVHSGLALTTNYTMVYGVAETNSSNLRFLEWGPGETPQLIQASQITPPFRIELYVRYRKPADVVIDPDA